MIPESLTIGRAVLSLRLLMVFASVAGGFLVAWFALGARRDSLRRLIVDALASAALLVIVGWKLTALFTQFDTIRREPFLLAYANGGRVGVAVGLFVAVVYLGWRFLRIQGSGLRPFDLVRGIAVVVAASMVMYVAVYGSAVAYHAATGGATQAAAVGRRAPEFSLQTLGVDGSSAVVSSVDLLGSPVVLNFWATWCGPCRAETAVKNQLARDYGERVHVMGVNLTNTEGNLDVVRAFSREWQIGYPILLDTDGLTADRYAVRGTPTTVILAPDGTVHTRVFGPMSYDGVAAVLRSLVD